GAHPALRIARRAASGSGARLTARLWRAAMRRDIEFLSQGTTCRGWLYTPDGREGPFPAIVMAGGTCYVKEIVMPVYAEQIAAQGVAVVLFDYRYCGDSDGSPRQHLDPWQQIEDYQNAISFVERLPEVDADRLGVWGISYSGTHALILAATDPRVKCMVSVVPLIDGYMQLKRQHGEEHFGRLMNHLASEREKRFADPSYVGSIPFTSKDPEHEICCYPAPDGYDFFMKMKATTAPNHEHWMTTASAEMLLYYS